MEKGENGSTTTTITRPPIPKKRVSLFRAAMQALRFSSKKKSKATTDTIMNTVNALRPLHHRLDYERTLPPPPPPSSLLEVDSYYDVHLPPPSPCSSVGMSRYASAEDLQALGAEDENEEEGKGDGEIDVKAEEFIKMFYTQMRSDSLKMVDEDMEME